MFSNKKQINLSDFNNHNYVAHYTKLDTAIRYILQDNKIKIGSVETLNDPYENTLDWFESDAGADKDHIKSYFNEKNIKAKLNKHIKVFSTTGFEENQILYSRPRMWSQYGDEHAGICLIFDKEELNEEFRALQIHKLYSDKVEYVLDDFLTMNNDVSVEAKKLELLLKDTELLVNTIDKNDFIHNRFFKKHTDWKAENEYRWCLFSKEEKDLFLDYKKSLKAIVLGSKLHPRYSAIFKECEIPVYYSEFRYGRYINGR